jgi:hypothetical protein
MTYVANIVSFSVEYRPEDGRKRPKHVGGVLFNCIILCPSIVQLLEKTL